MIDEKIVGRIDRLIAETISDPIQAVNSEDLIGRIMSRGTMAVKDESMPAKSRWIA
ncbi:MAG: hypothetical protein HP495_01790 [Nitrospira sp.]|nr:hypothetical protein [Nitrospira sp.]